MRVGLVAPPWVTVPPTRYGGTEAVIDVLARGLAAAGHEPVLFATGDSTCPVPLQSVHDHPPEPMGMTVPELHHVQAAYRALRHCDVIHDHTFAGPVWAAALRHGPPVLATNHGEFTPEVCAVYSQLSSLVTVNAISHSQRGTAKGVAIADVVHHGLELGDVAFGDGSGGYAMYIGRCTPEKGLHRAIDIARRAGLRLLVVAKMREAVEEHYFTERIRPLLGPDVDFLGEISPQERNALLREAVALVNPITWTEPFGLVMAESLAVGTPVITTRYGAAPEIVDHGVTGFLCDTRDEAVVALQRAPQLDRRACRAAVEQRFSAERMVADYVRLYRRLGASPAGDGVIDLRPAAPRSA